MRPTSISCFALGFIAVAACGARTRTPSHAERPELLDVPCGGGRRCDPLECLPVSPKRLADLNRFHHADGNEKVCTLACTSDADCPSWPNTGAAIEHCGPIVQSPCIEGRCEYNGCK